MSFRPPLKEPPTLPPSLGKLPRKSFVRRWPASSQEAEENSNVLFVGPDVDLSEALRLASESLAKEGQSGGSDKK